MRGFAGLGCRLLLVLALAVCVACGGNAMSEASNTGGAGPAGGMGASGGRVSSGGASNADGGRSNTKGGASSASGGASTGTGEVDPGSAVAGASAMGSGPCEGHSLGELVMTVHAQFPGLADIQAFYDPKSLVVGDGSFIYAFPTADGFRLVFTRGSGDCESGCIDKAYWYFETDAACNPLLVGHYSRVYSSSGNCFQTEGQPLWGFPGAPPPTGCGSTPQDVAGSYALQATGMEIPCSTLSPKSTPVSRFMTLVVTQDPKDASVATVTMYGTGNELIDGSSYSGTVTGSTLRVSVQMMRPASGADCGSTQYLTLDIDLATISGTLNSEEVRYLDCATMTYCKGMLQFTLAPSDNPI